MSYEEEPFDPYAYYTGQGNYAGLDLPAIDPAMLQVMQQMVPQYQPLSDKPLTAANQSSLLNSYGNLLFDAPMMAMGGVNAFSPDAFASTVSQTPVDAPMFSAFTGYLRNESTFEGSVASELINGGSASSAVQKMRAFIEANPDDPEAQRMIQLLPPVPYDAMADPEAPPQVDWSEAQNNARRIEEQFYVMPSAQRALLPQLLNPEASLGAEVQTEEGALSLGEDEMGNPVIMQTAVTPSEQAQKFTDLGLSLPTDTYQTEDFLPAEWEAQQQNHLNVVQPAVDQAMQQYLDTQRPEPLGAEQLAGQPAEPYQYAADREQANGVTPEERAMEALYRLTYDPNPISDVAGNLSSGVNAIGRTAAEYGGQVAEPLNGVWQGPLAAIAQVLGGGGWRNADDVAENVFGRAGEVASNIFGGGSDLEAMQWIEERQRQQAAEQLAGAAGEQAPVDPEQVNAMVEMLMQAGNQSIDQNPLDLLGGYGGPAGQSPGIGELIRRRQEGYGETPPPPEPGQDLWNRLTGEGPPPPDEPTSRDFGSDPATYDEFLTQLGFPTTPAGQAPPPGSTPQDLVPGSEMWNRLVGNDPTPPPPYAAPGAQPANQPGGPAYMEQFPQITDAMLRAILPGNDQRSTDLPPYAQQGAQPANQPGGPAYQAQNLPPYAQPGAQPANQPGGPGFQNPQQMTLAMLTAILGQQGRQPQPANQPGGPEYMEQFETGENYDPLSSAQTGERVRGTGAPRGRPTRTRAGQGGHQLLLRGQSQQRVRDRAHDDWINAFESGIRSQQATYGEDFGAALAQSRMAQQSGVTPYQQEMAMRRMVASAMGMPTGAYPGI